MFLLKSDFFGSKPGHIQVSFCTKLQLKIYREFSIITEKCKAEH